MVYREIIKILWNLVIGYEEVTSRECECMKRGPIIVFVSTTDKNEGAIEPVKEERCAD